MPSPAETAPTHVALLRGINVGGRHSLPMAVLRALVAEAGGRDVRTYIQSGNVLFRAPAELAARLPGTLAAAIESRFGFPVPVVLRGAEALAAVLAGNPFLAEGADPAHLHVGFLADVPTAESVAALDPMRSPPDRFQVHGGEVFLHCPNGMARTRLTSDWFDRGLGTVVTIRNWRTVERLAALAAE